MTYFAKYSLEWKKKKYHAEESYLKGYMQAIKDDSKALQVRIALLEEYG